MDLTTRYPDIVEQLDRLESYDKKELLIALVDAYTDVMNAAKLRHDVNAKVNEKQDYIDVLVRRRDLAMAILDESENALMPQQLNAIANVVWPAPILPPNPLDRPTTPAYGDQVRWARELLQDADHLIQAILDACPVGFSLGPAGQASLDAWRLSRKRFSQDTHEDNIG